MIKNESTLYLFVSLHEIMFRQDGKGDGLSFDRGDVCVRSCSVSWPQPLVWSRSWTRVCGCRRFLWFWCRSYWLSASSRGGHEAGLKIRIQILSVETQPPFDGFSVIKDQNTWTECCRIALVHIYTRLSAIRIILSLADEIKRSLIYKTCCEEIIQM